MFTTTTLASVRRVTSSLVILALVVTMSGISAVPAQAVTVNGIQFACPDITGDGFVDASDLSAYAAAAAQTPQSMVADFTGDAAVDADDQTVLAAWLGHAVNCQTNSWSPVGANGFCALACPDMNHDGNIDASDLSAFAGAEAVNDIAIADFNGDGVVDVRDRVYIEVLLGTTNFVCCVPSNSVTITKTDGKTTATAGETTTYSITLTNTNAVDVNGLKVTDTLPGNYGSISTVSDAGVWNGSTSIVWDNISLAAGASKTLTYNGVVSASIAIGLGTTLTNTAALECSTGSNCGVSGSAVDTTIVTAAPIAVSPQPTLSLQKVVDGSTTQFNGATISYTVMVKNTSPTLAAMNVTLTDTLPAGLTFKADGSSTTKFFIGNLLPGASSSVQYDVLVAVDAAAAIYTNTVVASADNAASVLANASVTVQGPLVLGETDGGIDGEVQTVKVLAETGPSAVDMIIFSLAAMAVAAGFVTLRRAQVLR